MPAPWYNPQFGQQVISAFGKVTPEKMRFIQAWAQAEGTKARYNPLATTRKGYMGESNFNSVGVKNYTSVKQGIKATIDTLKLDYYTHLTKLLRSDNVTAEQLAEAVAQSPWGTGAGVLRVLGVTSANSYEVQTKTAKFRENKAKVETQFVTRTLDEFRPGAEWVKMAGEINPVLGRLAAGYEPFTITEKKQTLVTSGRQNRTATSTTPGGVTDAPGYTGGFEGKVWVLPTTWKADHPTDGLSGSGWTGARDLFPGAPGTPVGAPESGVITAWDPNGAQGGGRIRFRSDSGYEYWIGHIDNGLAAGTRVKRGQPIAVVSSHHDNPHVHIDRRRIGKGK